MVDEFQDVNPLQDRLLKGWLGDGDSVTVVGDSAQTIYSFTGAESKYLETFSQRFPNARQISLIRNYRSTPQIIATANAVLHAAAPKGTPALTLQAQREGGKPPEIVVCADELEEATTVVQRIAAQKAAGVPLSEIAILYRINAQSENYEQALAEAGIAYVLKGGERFFDRPEVRQAMTLIRGAARAIPGGLLNQDMADGAALEPAGSVAGLGQAVRAVLLSMGWDDNPPSGAGAVREKWESLSALAGLADEFEASTPPAGLAEFVLELSERSAAQHAPAVDGVTLVSLHAAKGLEWSCVHLVGLVDGTLPLIHASTSEQIAEERRLFYVGITRARDELVMSWSKSRNGRGTREPSRFLAALGAAVVGSAPKIVAEPRVVKGPKSAVKCRVCTKVLTVAAERKLKRCLTCEVDFDEALFDRLREWRLAEANRVSVPAFVIFTDATLQAIAEAEPSNEAGLLAIVGIGQSKLQRYGSAVRLVLDGGSAEDALAASEAAAANTP